MQWLHEVDVFFNGCSKLARKKLSFLWEINLYQSKLLVSIVNLKTGMMVSMMMHLRVLSMLICLTGVLLMVSSQKKTCLSSSDSYPLFINSRSWKEIGNETFINPSLWVNSGIKFAHRLIDTRVYYVYMLLLLCGDIESLPGAVRYNTRRDSLLTSRGLKLFHQNVSGFHAKLNLITAFLRGRNIDFLTLSETRTHKTLITLKFSAFRSTTIFVKVQRLLLVETLAFIFRKNTTSCVQKI